MRVVFLLLDVEPDWVVVVVGVDAVPSVAMNGLTALPPLACEKSQLKESAWLWYEMLSLGSFESSGWPAKAAYIHDALELWKSCKGVSAD
jgi:hypothetical protein